MSVDLKSIFGSRIQIGSKLRSIMGVFFNQDSQEVTDYKPSYQRNYVWDDEKATYFIESIFLGTEIPPLVYFKTITDEAIKNEIIDGRQRYQTILRFVQGDLRLKKNGLQRLGEVKGIVGKTFDELDDNYKSLFQETRIRIIEIRFLTDHTPEEEDALKKEIFQRYNSGITPLRNLDIFKAQYYYNDLNTYLKHELKEDPYFDVILSRVLRLEKSKPEQKAMKIRELLVLNRIPIKYYAIQKQQVIRKYFELLSNQITEEEIKDVYDDFRRRLGLLDFIETGFAEAKVPYNRLIGECLYWAISIVEMETGQHLQDDMFVRNGLINHIKENIDKYTTVRSSFANILFERFECTASFFGQEYNCDFTLYLYNNEKFKKENKQVVLTQEAPQKFDELRINKPDPTSVEVSELLLNINSNRFLIRPPYQRNEVGNRKKSSSIIESLLLGITLPPIFVFKRADGVSEVIDGQQRILSILGYIGKPYRDEKGNEQYSKQNKFSLDLRDNGILKDFQNTHFDDLPVKDRNKIMSADLSVIDIKESQNPNFDPVDLFVRLNNKPYPIAKDSFEMWNSFASRELIDTIKSAVKHNDKWFYLRQKNDRMDNENLFTTLAYFQYAYLQNGNAAGELVPERTLELFKIGNRINCRFRLRPEISKLMEQENHSDFIYAINSLEFGFVRNVKTILEVEPYPSTINGSLSKRLDSLLNFVGSKRTQMMFYLLWILLHDLSNKKIAESRFKVFNRVKEIVTMFSDGTDIDDFKATVNEFRNEYASIEPEVDFHLLEVAELLDNKDIREEKAEKESLEEDKQNVDMVLDLILTPMRRFNVQHVQGELPLMKQQLGIKMTRSGIAPRFVESVLKSRLFYYYCTALKSPQVKKTTVANFEIPFVSPAVQVQMAKVLLYTEIATGLERDFFERILDLMVYERIAIDEFHRANISVLDIVKDLPDLAEVDDENRRKIILKEVYSRENQPDAQMALMLLKSIDLEISRKIETGKKDA